MSLLNVGGDGGFAGDIAREAFLFSVKYLLTKKKNRDVGWPQNVVECVGWSALGRSAATLYRTPLDRTINHLFEWFVSPIIIERDVYVLFIWLYIFELDIES